MNRATRSCRGLAETISFTNQVARNFAAAGSWRGMLCLTLGRSAAQLLGDHRRLLCRTNLAKIGVSTRTSSMKLSARNQLKGKIVAVVKGQTTAHVRIDLGNGMVVTSSITNEAVDDLQLAPGDEAIAIVKASDVMIAK
jgi:molybdopterin-binding protein